MRQPRLTAVEHNQDEEFLTFKDKNDGRLHADYGGGERLTPTQGLTDAPCRARDVKDIS
jgi:hypothetical protein